LILHASARDVPAIGTNWPASSSQPWLTLSQTSGTNAGSIEVTANATTHRMFSIRRLASLATLSVVLAACGGGGGGGGNNNPPVYTLS
jgi:hypothetical protein